MSMKYEDFKKQAISAVREEMNTQRIIYNDLIEEEPDSEYEFALMRRACIEGIARGAIAIVKKSDYTYNHIEKLEKSITRLIDEYKE